MTDRYLNSRLVFACLLWCALALLSLGWNVHQLDRHREELALGMARAFFEQIVVTRGWNARHGGVYVPVNEHTQPNPYLQVPHRDLRISDTLTLTLVNPAFMTRQLSEIAQERNGIQFRITSLVPLRPENAATPWETEALHRFEQGELEVGEFVAHEGGDRYRYMAPLRTEKDCLRCHEQQGYREGDIRGGISVTLPNVASIPLFALVASHLAIAACGTLIILIMGQMLASSYRKMRQLAEIDPLTGVPNRRFLNEHLHQELRRRRQTMPLSVILCDIDHFKAYNDHFGHPGGDQCLRLVAQCLQGSLQRAGDFCARYGGEEFILVLPNTPRTGAALLADRIRQTILGLQLPHPMSAAGVVSMSFGVATTENAILDNDTLIQQADQALYRAKHRGRNRVEAFEVRPSSDSTPSA